MQAERLPVSCIEGHAGALLGFSLVPVRLLSVFVLLCEETSNSSKELRDAFFIA